jgi:hypothetical protein
MPFIFDEFGQKKEVTESTFYLTGVVDRLFDDMLEILGGRIKVSVFRQNWYQLVPFILFVLRLGHARAQKDIDNEIQLYISDPNNPESYMNKFNNPEYKSLKEYEPLWLAETVGQTYGAYWDLFNESSAKGEDPSFAINEQLGRKLAAEDDEQPNLHDAFSFMESKFLKGEVRLFQG